MKCLSNITGFLISRAGAFVLVFALAMPGSVSAAYDYWLLADVSASDAAALVIKKTGGKVLKVTEEERDGRWVYRIKVLLPEGRVKTVMVNKESGSIGG